MTMIAMGLMKAISLAAADIAVNKLNLIQQSHGKEFGDAIINQC